MGQTIGTRNCSFFHCECGDREGKEWHTKCYNQTLQNNNIVIHIFRIFIGEYNYFSKESDTIFSDKQDSEEIVRSGPSFIIIAATFFFDVIFIVTFTN